MTEHGGGTDGTDRPSRSWKIPPRIYGRVRTSTVALGVCFVLTALLYGQVRPEPAAEQVGPQPIDTSQYSGDQPNYQSEYTEPSATTPPSSTVDPSGTEDPSNTGATSGEPGFSGESTTGDAGTQDPTYLPGLTVPPELRSLLPSAPRATANP
ncbi:MAG: hypothetical protein WBD41_15255 [Rhodococcus sp. (in: high G+C Gram-positive bacteria)]|jgi:hypothetical protein|uniref:hypothetical protein n=1 Tax=Rhodococcus sp. EPR-157 TaxID=1813677 RepID=UPI0007BB263A|nr:hypothetical protein [Rhodococcus sp. EPR-157]KZF12864.1 hypothetical protein A2J03_16790 [Rhodococcus sp. EPR-157]